MSRQVTKTLAHTIIIDETRCQPQLCPRGICLAKKVCPYKCILQYDPGEIPIGNSAHCNGCAVCAQRCPTQAIAIL